MRRTLSIAVILLAVSQTVFSGASEEVFEEEIVWSELVEDTEFEVGDRLLLFSKANAVGHYVDGTFCFGTLVEPLTCTVRDAQVRLAAGSYASFWRDGSLKATYVSVEPFEFPIQGEWVRILGEYDIYLPLMFRESGELHYGNLAEPTAFVVQDREVVCKGAISFHENGVFRLGTLVEDSYFSVQGGEIAFKADHIVRFTDEAVLNMGRLAEDTAFELWGQEVMFRGGTEMNFYPHGEVLIGYLRTETVFKVNGREITVPASSHEAAIFSRTGHPSFMHGPRDVIVEIRGKSVETATTSFEYADLLFRPGGGILQGTLAGDTELETREGPVTYPALTVITFDAEGFVEQAEELIPYEM